MSEKIDENLARTFSKESKSSARIGTFAFKADKEGYPQLARLFRAVENAKSVHANRLLLLMRGKIDDTEANLQEAYDTELSALKLDFPPMVEDAKEAVSAVKKAFIQSMKTNQEYAELFKSAMDDKLSGEDRVYYVCRICGHIHFDTAPDNCPVCRAVPGRFKKV